MLFMASSLPQRCVGRQSWPQTFDARRHERYFIESLPCVYHCQMLCGAMSKLCRAVGEIWHNLRDRATSTSGQVWTPARLPANSCGVRMVRPLIRLHSNHRHVPSIILRRGTRRGACTGNGFEEEVRDETIQAALKAPAARSRRRGREPLPPSLLKATRTVIFATRG